MVTNKGLIYKNPAGVEIEVALLKEFENGLDPLHPETSKVPCHVLGFGEISTVFEIQEDQFKGLALKRMCIFRTMEELQSYLVTWVHL